MELKFLGIFITDHREVEEEWFPWWLAGIGVLIKIKKK
jgi:hypothetical protein